MDDLPPALHPRPLPISTDGRRRVVIEYYTYRELAGPPETIGRQIKAAIRAAVGLTASVGIASNRLVAKIASDFGKPDGLVVVTPDQVLDFLGGQPVGVLRGVGRRTLPLLQRLGLRTVADLRGLSLTQLQAHLGPRVATSLYQQARGITSDRVGERAARQSLAKETTFGADVTDPRVLRDTLRDLAAEVAAAARQEGIAGRTLTLKIRFCGFETHTRQRRFQQRSDDARTLFAAAWSLYETARWQGKPVRLIGLGISDLGTPEPVQPDLFDGGAQQPADSERARRLTVTVERIHARFGADALRRGMSITDPLDMTPGRHQTPEGPQ